MRLGGGRILGGVVGSQRHVPKAHAPQQRTHAALGQAYAEPALDHLGQVDPPPANDAMFGQVGARADQVCQFILLLGREAWLGAGRLAIR